MDDWYWSPNMSVLIVIGVIAIIVIVAVIVLICFWNAGNDGGGGCGKGNVEDVETGEGHVSVTVMEDDVVAEEDSSPCEDTEQTDAAELSSEFSITEKKDTKKKRKKGRR